MGSKIDVATKCTVVAKDYSSKSVKASVVQSRALQTNSQQKGSMLLYVKLGSRDKIWCYEMTKSSAGLVGESWSPTHPSKDLLPGLTCGIVSFEWSGRKRSADC